MRRSRSSRPDGRWAGCWPRVTARTRPARATTRSCCCSHGWGCARSATRWSSHKDIAAKALRKLAGPHVPASLGKLEKAVKRANAAYEQAERAALERRHSEAAADGRGENAVEEESDEDLAEVA